MHARKQLPTRRNAASYRLALLLVALLFVCGCRAQIKCPNDWSGKVVIVPAEKINDGYCDCPLTGADEPNTSACSGSFVWSGATRGADKTEDPPAPPLFTCPQQPKLQLPSSRMNDGICDCCDGADEPDTGICKDDCAEVLAEERRLRQQLEQKFKKGSETRQKSIQSFQTLRQQKLQEAQQMEAEIVAVEATLDQMDDKYQTLEPLWLKKRLETVHSRAMAVGLGNGNLPKGIPNSLKGMLASLSEEELTWWIVHACQMAGESVADHSSMTNVKTCVPLRMAGLDSGIWWEPNSFEMTVVSDSNPQLAKLLDYNLKNGPSQLIWNVERLPKGDSKSQRRRLQEDLEDYDDFDEDDFHHMDDDYLDRYDDLEDDEYEEDMAKYDRHRHGNEGNNHNNNNNIDSESETRGDKRDELLALIKSQPFSTSRVNYLERSTALLSTIDEVTKKAEEEEDEKADSTTPETPEEVEKADEAAATSETNAQPEVQFDPMALPMTKNELKRRQKSIERGFDYALSAKVLLDSLAAYSFETPELMLLALQKLAFSVLNHGKHSAVQVWHLYLSVLPEFSTRIGIDKEQETCVAPWASICPPPAPVKRVVANVEYELPAQTIVEEAIAYCKSLEGQSTEAICASDNQIPSDVPNGYFGYSSLPSRTENDPMTKMFADMGLEDNSPERGDLLNLQNQIRELEKKKEDLKSSASDTVESVGGKDGPDSLGRDGELYSLKDECLIYEAAKYTYELCLFKGAKQKEGGGSGGVNLGQWSGYEEDEEGARIWNWTKGTKCWNGPQRSATAIVMCGSETKVLSADEPETCRYVFEVESPVACDDSFRTRNNI